MVTMTVSAMASGDRGLLADNIDQFRRAHRLAEVQREHLQRVRPRTGRSPGPGSAGTVARLAGSIAGSARPRDARFAFLW
jgi:hypothetical protein